MAWTPILWGAPCCFGKRDKLLAGCRYGVETVWGEGEYCAETVPGICEGRNKERAKAGTGQRRIEARDRGDGKRREMGAEAERIKGDERILGEREFVEDVLRSSKEEMEREISVESSGV